MQGRTLVTRTTACEQGIISIGLCHSLVEYLMPSLQAVVHLCDLETLVVSVLLSALRVSQAGGLKIKGKTMENCAMVVRLPCVCLAESPIFTCKWLSNCL